MTIEYLRDGLAAVQRALNDHSYASNTDHGEFTLVHPRSCNGLLRNQACCNTTQRPVRRRVVPRPTCGQPTHVDCVNRRKRTADLPPSYDDAVANASEQREEEAARSNATALRPVQPPTAEAASRPRSTRKTRTPKCFACKEEGHLVKNCAAKAAASRRRAVRDELLIDIHRTEEEEELSANSSPSPPPHPAATAAAAAAAAPPPNREGQARGEQRSYRQADADWGFLLSGQTYRGSRQADNTASQSHTSGPNNGPQRDPDDPTKIDRFDLKYVPSGQFRDTWEAPSPPLTRREFDPLCPNLDDDDLPSDYLADVSFACASEWDAQYEGNPPVSASPGFNETTSSTRGRSDRSPDTAYGETANSSGSITRTGSQATDGARSLSPLRLAVYRPKHKTFFEPGQPPDESHTCFGCGSPNHYKRNCPKAVEGLSAALTASRIEERGPRPQPAHPTRFATGRDRPFTVAGLTYDELPSSDVDLGAVGQSDFPSPPTPSEIKPSAPDHTAYLEAELERSRRLLSSANRQFERQAREIQVLEGEVERGNQRVRRARENLQNINRLTSAENFGLPSARQIRAITEFTLLCTGDDTAQPWSAVANQEPIPPPPPPTRHPGRERATLSYRQAPPTNAPDGTVTPTGTRSTSPNPTVHRGDGTASHQRRKQD